MPDKVDLATVAIAEPSFDKFVFWGSERLLNDFNLPFANDDLIDVHLNSSRLDISRWNPS